MEDRGKSKIKGDKGRDSKLQEVGPIPQVGTLNNNSLIFYDVCVQKLTSIATTVACKREPVVGKVDRELVTRT